MHNYKVEPYLDGICEMLIRYDLLIGLVTIMRNGMANEGYLSQNIIRYYSNIRDYKSLGLVRLRRMSSYSWEGMSDGYPHALWYR
jgi:hypothetical protein